MKKDITKKFLGKEDRYTKKMLSKEIVAFIFRKKINIDTNQISYDKIEVKNIFSTEFTNLNTKNVLESGDMFKEFVRKDGKSIEFNMIYCDKGTFTMGSDVLKDKNPKKQVEIEKPFLLGETEVTQELYKLVMDNKPIEFKEEEDSSQRPMIYATWYDAIMFCNKLSLLTNKRPYYEIKGISYRDDGNTSIVRGDIKINEGANGFRLPLEKDWEYAAKAGTNNQWVGTNDENKLEEYAWFDKNSNNETHPVATKKPNEWGFYDMSGNVWEWCYDLFNNTTNRVLRGGCFDFDAPYLRSACHLNSTPSVGNEAIGFRVSASLVN